MKPEVFYCDTDFTHFWKTHKEAAENCCKVSALVNLSDYNKAVEALKEIEKRTVDGPDAWEKAAMALKELGE